MTANMNLIGDFFQLVSLSYRYCVQCDRGFIEAVVYIMRCLFSSLHDFFTHIFNNANRKTVDSSGI